MSARDCATGYVARVLSDMISDTTVERSNTPPLIPTFAGFQQRIVHAASHCLSIG
jgi:hypothetical protein